MTRWTAVGLGKGSLVDSCFENPRTLDQAVCDLEYGPDSVLDKRKLVRQRRVS